MPLQPGATLGPYEIQAPLGAGGMGEVYKARDTRLDRTVAIKVLPEHVAADPDLKQRFEREARTVAALNHPHICTLFDIGREGETDFLVMEYLDGETLAQRLDKGALPLDQALQIAIQIADALDKAHRQGIVHRDLKPGNIMLTTAGAKLLDFGLAKLKPMGAAFGESGLPTKSASLTGAGTILGTLQYMAPEQLEGKEADARTDIFAFGTVVYEMVTGTKAFAGESQASLIAAILDRDPSPMAAVQPMSPAALEYVARHCLAKVPDDRWQSVADVRRQLNGITEGVYRQHASGRVAAPEPVSWPRTVGAAVAAAAILAVVTGVAVWSLMRRDPPRPTRTLIATDEPLHVSQAGGDVVISPDGTRVVYTAQGPDGLRYLRVRALDQLDTSPLAEPISGSPNAFFSPNAAWVGFHDQDALKRVSVFGGPPLTIYDPVSSFRFRGASWAPDDMIIFSVASTSDGLWRVPSAGGDLERLTVLDTESGEVGHWWPHVLPGGRAALFSIRTRREGNETDQVAVVSLETLERRVLLPEGSYPRYVSTGHVVYGVEGALRAVRFDLDRLEASGDPATVLEPVMTKRFGEVNFDVSEDGLLVYIAGEPAGLEAYQSTLVWVDPNGRTTPMTNHSASYSLQPRLSPDGQELAVVIESGDRSDIWIYDVERGNRVRLTSERFVNTRPVWTPGGASVIFRSDRFGADEYELFSKTPGSSDAAELLLGRDGPQYSDSMFHGEGLLAFQDGNPPRDIWVLPQDGEPRPFLTSRFDERQAAFSPQGRALAYISDESGRFEVYVQPYPGPGSKIPISFHGGQEEVDPILWTGVRHS